MTRTYNKLNDWYVCGAELCGTSSSGQEVGGLYEFKNPDLKPGDRVGIVGAGWWVLGQPDAYGLLRKVHLIR